MLDRPLFSYLDAGESVERSYTVFLSRLPAGTKQIAHVQSVGARINLKFD